MFEITVLVLTSSLLLVLLLGHIAFQNFAWRAWFNGKEASENDGAIQGRRQPV